MVIRHIEAHPELANRVFQDVGTRRSCASSSTSASSSASCSASRSIFIVEAFPYWWVLPICGVVIG